MLTADLVSQLHTIGGLPEWEIYICMHLPDSPDAASSREQLVKGLLTRNAHYWEAQSERTEFLKALGFPQAWLLEAKSVWAKARGDQGGEMFHLELVLVCCFKAAEFQLFRTASLDVKCVESLQQSCFHQ